MSSVAAVQAQRVIINGGEFIIDNRTSQQEIQALPPGMKTLVNSERISWNSLYNSNTRMNEANEMAVIHAVEGWHSFLKHKTSSAPTFDHAGVDDAINAIFSWVSDSSSPSLIMWVHDDDRTKTSFIAQVVAYLLEKRGQLSATYFFDGNTDRNSLVPTLVHELVMHDRHDHLRLEVSRILEKHPGMVFTYTPREQLKRLLVAPLKTVSESYRAQHSNDDSGPFQVQILQDDMIILHGFEDCSDESGFQESFLSAFSDALVHIKATLFPQKLLVIGKRTSRLEEILTGKMLRSPILQRPVQIQDWLKRDQDILQKTVELKRWEDGIQRKQDKLLQDLSQHEEECERNKTVYAKQVQEVQLREKLVNERENKVREKEESVERKLKELKAEKSRIQQQERGLRIRENEIKTKEDLFGVVNYVPPTAFEDILPPTPSSGQSIPKNTPTQEPGMPEDARMISPASQVTKSDRVFILMGPLVPLKRHFIDRLTNCTNPWRFHPSTETSNQFFDSLEDNLGKGRFWIKAVRTQRQAHSILFVDFPSLGDDDLAAARILENIGTWLNDIRINEAGKIAGILYFHPLPEFERRGPSHRNLRALGQICGETAAKKVIVVFEELSPPLPQKAEAFFQQHYGHLMNKLGAGFAYFDNTATSGWGIVDRLLGPQSEDVSLLLQEELLLRESLHETYAARQLYGDLITRHKMRALGILASGSHSTKDRHDKIRAELERLQPLQRGANKREPQKLAKPLNFPDLLDFPETD